jgi:hypothetical protein
MAKDEGWEFARGLSNFGAHALDCGRLELYK